MANNILDIHCPSCGAPAKYDIRSGDYLCSYCGERVGVDAAKREKQNARGIRRELLFVPPICFLVWLGILSFCVMVYLTANGPW